MDGPERIASDAALLARARAPSPSVRIAVLGTAWAVALSTVAHFHETGPSDVRAQTWLGVLPQAGLLYGFAGGIAFAILAKRLASPPDARRIVLAGALGAALSYASLAATFASGTFVDGTPIPAGTTFGGFLADLAASSHLRGSSRVGPPEPPLTGGAWSFALDSALAFGVAGAIVWCPGSIRRGKTGSRAEA